MAPDCTLGLLAQADKIMKEPGHLIFDLHPLTAKSYYKLTNPPFVGLVVFPHRWLLSPRQNFDFDPWELIAR